MTKPAAPVEDRFELKLDDDAVRAFARRYDRLVCRCIMLGADYPERSDYAAWLVVRAVRRYRRHTMFRERVDAVFRRLQDDGETERLGVMLSCHLSSSWNGCQRPAISQPESQALAPDAWGDNDAPLTPPPWLH